MSAFCMDNEAMKTFELQNMEWCMHSRRVYNDISKMGITSLINREQEYVKRMEALPDRIRRKDDPDYEKYNKKSAMKPPRVGFVEEETDLDNYYEGSSIQQRYEEYQPRENHVQVQQTQVPTQNHVEYFFRRMVPIRTGAGAAGA